MVKKLPAVLLLFCAAVFSVHAESGTTVTLRLFSIIQPINEQDISFTGSGSGRISISSERNRNVKGEFALNAVIGDTAVLSVYRAFVKIRFPRFRLTIGKAPVSWGDGTAFNAGDVIFRTNAPAQDLTADELRDNAIWLTSVYVPFGPFSFFEGLVLPPQINAAELISNPSAEPPLLSETGAGGRFYFKLGNMKIESGYLYDGRIPAHLPYLSLQGNLFFDWYISASTAVPLHNASPGNVYENLKISCGLFYQHRFRTGDSLSFRIESMLRPQPLFADSETADAESILLYPEIIWGIGSSGSVLLRSIFSPVDLSALVLLGGAWNIYQGIELLGFFSFQAGGPSDLYGYPQSGWISLILGLQYIY